MTQPDKTAHPGRNQPYRREGIQQNMRQIENGRRRGSNLQIQ